MKADIARFSATAGRGCRAARPLYTSRYCSQPAGKKKRTNWVVALNRDFLCIQLQRWTDKTVHRPGPGPRLSRFPQSSALQGRCPFLLVCGKASLLLSAPPNFTSCVTGRLFWSEIRFIRKKHLPTNMALKLLLVLGCLSE